MRGSVVSLDCQHKIYLFNKAILIVSFMAIRNNALEQLHERG
ncbi:hypothetical protein [Candidatus Symbiopectobacterium sp.]|nr:hypothetical protein [Candidatus Symbiopectobacterium sp.]